MMKQLALGVLYVLSVLCSVALISMFVVSGFATDEPVKKVSAVLGAIAFTLGGSWFSDNKRAKRWHEIFMVMLFGSFVLWGGWYSIGFGSALVIGAALDIWLWRLKKRKKEEP